MSISFKHICFYFSRPLSLARARENQWEMDPEDEIVSILTEIYQSRFAEKKDLSGCFVCGKDVNFFRKTETDKRFCSTTCNHVEYLSSRYFQLGMKRSARDIEIIKSGEEEWRFITFPDEIQALVILMAFDYKIEKNNEWEQLMKIRLLTNKHHKTIVDTLVLPNLHYVNGRVLSGLADEMVEKLTGLQILKIPLIQSDKKSFWNDMVGKMKSLVDLDISLVTLHDPFPTETLKNLTRLVCGKQITDENLNGLVKLTHLGLSNYESQITDKGLAYVSNITILEFGSSSYLNQLLIMKITPFGLQNLKYLRKVILNGVDRDLITPQHLQAMSEIKELHLIDAHFTNLDAFTNLEKLKMVSSSSLRETALPLSSNLTKLTMIHIAPIYVSHLLQCTKLVKLELSGLIKIYGDDNQIVDFFSNLLNLEILNISKNDAITDDHLSRLITLKSLNLQHNKKITDNGISTLTNLTTLNLDKNDKITNRSLRKLKSLQLIQEDGRTYRTSPDGLTFY